MNRKVWVKKAPDVLEDVMPDIEEENSEVLGILLHICDNGMMLIEYSDGTCDFERPQNIRFAIPFEDSEPWPIGFSIYQSAKSTNQ